MVRDAAFGMAHEPFDLIARREMIQPCVRGVAKWVLV